MSGLVTITPELAPAPREVLHGAGKTTVLDWLFERDGAASSVTAATALLKSGSTTLGTYTTGGSGVVITGGRVEATIQGNHFLNYSLFDHLWVALTVTADGREERYGERVLVTDQIVRCPCRLAEVLALHRDFLDTANYQEGYEVGDASPGWAYVLERVWQDVRMEVAAEFPQVDWARVRAPVAMRPWIRHRCAAEIADTLAGDRGRSSEMLDFAERHTERADWWKGKARVEIRDGGSAAHPDEPALLNIEVESPSWMHTRNTEGYI